MSTDTALVFYVTREWWEPREGPLTGHRGSSEDTAALMAAIEADGFRDDWYGDEVTIIGPGKYEAFRTDGYMELDAAEVALQRLMVPYGYGQGPNSCAGWDEESPDTKMWTPALGAFTIAHLGLADPATILAYYAELEDTSSTNVGGIRRIVDEACGGPWQRALDELAASLPLNGHGSAVTLTPELHGEHLDDVVPGHDVKSAIDLMGRLSRGRVE